MYYSGFLKRRTYNVLSSVRQEASRIPLLNFLNSISINIIPSISILPVNEKAIALIELSHRLTEYNFELLLAGLVEEN